MSFLKLLNNIRLEHAVSDASVHRQDGDEDRDGKRISESGGIQQCVPGNLSLHAGGVPDGNARKTGEKRTAGKQRADRWNVWNNI